MLMGGVHEQETASREQVSGEQTLEDNEEQARFVSENLTDFFKAQHTKHRSEDEASIDFKDRSIYRHRDKDKHKQNRDI